VDVRALALIVLAACSGKTTAPKTAVEDARGSGSAPGADAGVLVTPGGKGDVQIRVEWKDVPAVARASPGQTPCGTPRPAQVSPNVLWGVPDVIVALDAPPPGGAAAAAAKRIVLESCRLSPRVVVASGTITLASATETPSKLFLQRAGQLPLGGAITDDKPRAVQLPTAGHEVEVALDAGAIMRVVAGSEDAWIIASDSPYVAVTEGSGNVVLRGVPSGTHGVTAWLPARSGQPARVARGKVTVPAGALAEVTLDITKQ
jgi:hypothetical protein